MSLSANDRLEIQDLCARYYLSTDAGDVEGFMECWIDDEEIKFESAFGTFSGTEEIHQFETHHVSEGGMAVGRRHILSNVSIREGESKDVAFVETYLTVLEVVDAPFIVATAHYPNCRVERTEEGWKFRHRKMEVDPGFEQVMVRLQAAS